MTESERMEWLRERKRGIGGSEAHHLFNEPPYGCARQLWYDKRDVEPDYPKELTLAMQRGTRMEPLVAELYAEQTGRTMEERPAFVSPTDPHMRVNVDRIIVGDPRGEGVLEVKTHHHWMFRRVKFEGLQPSHILQLQHALLVTDLSWGAYAVLHPDTWQLLHFDVDRDAVLIARIREAGARFWRQVENGPAPDALPEIDNRCKTCPWRKTCRGEALLMAAGPVDETESAMPLEHDDGLAPVVADYLEAKRMADEAGETLEIVSAALKQRLGDRQAVETEGARIFYRPQVSHRLDTKLVRTKYPAVAKECERDSISRPLRVVPY